MIVAQVAGGRRRHRRRRGQGRDARHGGDGRGGGRGARPRRRGAGGGRPGDGRRERRRRCSTRRRARRWSSGCCRWPTVVTPNIPEARALTGAAEGDSQEDLAREVLALGPARGGRHRRPQRARRRPLLRRSRGGRDRGRAPSRRRLARLRLHPLLGAGRPPGARRDAARGGRASAREVASAAVAAGLREIGEGPGPVDVFGLDAASDLRLSRFRPMSTNGATTTKLPRPRSSAVFDGPDRAHSRAYMKGIGFDDDALSRPTIGIANTWTEAMPCNFHLRGLAEHVKEGVRAAGGTPMEFNTVAISDGVTMGTQGMKASLVSREVIADSIELMARGYQFDAIVALCACDKTIPGCAMALARLDVPSVAPLRRLDRPRPLARPRRHDPRHLRGDRRPQRRRHERRGTERARGRRQPRRRRLRRPVHRQHDGLRLRGARGQRRRLGDGPGRRRREGHASPSGSASW